MTATDDTSVEERLGELSLAQKVELLTGANSFTLRTALPAGLHEIRMSDGPNGVRGVGDDEVAALFPNATLLAATWSEDAAFRLGELLAEEAMAQRVHVVLGPTVNLHRSVLGGRLFEQYSEDPLLTGRLAAAYVRGLQERGVAACVKHYVANESETDRTSVSSDVDQATLREVYLLPFEIAVKDADPWAIMAAYNRVNGVPATEHAELLTAILRDDWGWTGVVVSDWGAAKTAAPAANAGLDLVMPGPGGPWGEALVAAVETGEVSESVVDGHVARLLRLAARVGALDEARSWPDELPAPGSAERRQQLIGMAAEGMTVIKNAAGLLPLRREARVAVIGRHAVETIATGGGAAWVRAPHVVHIADAMRDRGSVIIDGVEVLDRPPAAVADALRDGMRVRLFDAEGALLDEHHAANGRTTVHWNRSPPLARIELSAAASADGDLELGGLGIGDWSLRYAASIAEFSLDRLGGGMAEEVLAPPVHAFRATVASPTTITASIDVSRVCAGNHTVDAVFGSWGLVVRAAPRPVSEVLADAAAAAHQADVAVVVVGTTDQRETEALDKLTIALSGAQDELVRAVARAAARTVVVVNAATPILMPWIDDVDAVLWAGLPGQEGGHAVAAALFGEVEPAGRLTTSFPRSDGAAPAWSVTPVDGLLRYQEGRLLGYRGHWAGRAPAPLFWLGHGLGYGEWEYGPPALGTGQPAVIEVDVTNVGSRGSREVVQVYLEPDGEPIRLAGWTTVSVEPGQTVRARVATDARAWRSWDAQAGAWAPITTGGLLIARGLGDVRGRMGFSGGGGTAL